MSHARTFIIFLTTLMAMLRPRFRHMSMVKVAFELGERSATRRRSP